MDFKPGRNTLVANYLATFGVVGAILWLSVGKIALYYYSPEYTSHATYGSVRESCSQCHVQRWNAVSESTCWTAGCHASFAPEKSQEDVRALTADEFGKEKPQFGALLAFHQQMAGRFSCAECHPSHRLPQTARFNSATIAEELQRRFAPAPPRDEAEVRASRADVFHAGAERVVGRVSCVTCHVGK